jgi:manganese/zinc/iron transport system permease protein
LEGAAETGEVILGQGEVELTPLGLRRAAELTKTHRLWELYMMQHAGIAADHVDRDADDVEHLLPESLLVELEQQLAAEHRLPAVVSEVPKSPHEIETEITTSPN